MAAVVPAADKASDLMQKLSLEPKSKTPEVPAVAKKNSAIQTGGRSMTPIVQNADPNMYYYSNGYTSSYYFGGHDGIGDWDYSRYLNHDGIEMATGYYGDMYGYGYSSYGAYPYTASPTIGHDGQLNSPQNYQYPAPYFQPPSPAPYNPPNQSFASKEISTTTSSAKQTPFSQESTKIKANGSASIPNGNSNGSLVAAQKTGQQNSVLASNNFHNKSGSVLANGLMGSPSPWLDASTNNTFSLNGAGINSTALGRNHSSRPFSSNLGAQNQRAATGIVPATTMMVNGVYPNRLYNAYPSGLGYRSGFYDSRTNGRWGYVDNKYKSRGRGNGFYGVPNVTADGLSELNRGPRATRVKSLKVSVPTAEVAASKEQIPSENEDSNDKDEYNKEDFPVEYSDAKFFIIKSYSEDDVHKSVKYNVWASTQSGNKKLDSAYREAEGRAAACPIFLFFSVNTSGQFVGVAEMKSPVDFEKSVDYWQQDKWTGCFSVKWHIVKDVPNNALKHIIIENNDNKPVTNSRDTQEVKLEQGLEMLELFQGFASKTCILDDFNFYETRQKVMQEKRAKPVDAAAAVDKKNQEETGKPKFVQPDETDATVLKEVSNTVGNGDKKQSNGLAPAAESKVVTVAN